MSRDSPKSATTTVLSCRKSSFLFLYLTGLGAVCSVSWMWLVATYQFNQAVVRVEVSVDDAHGMKVSLEQRRKYRSKTFPAVSYLWSMFLLHEVLFFSLLWNLHLRWRSFENTASWFLPVATACQPGRGQYPLSGSPFCSIINRFNHQLFLSFIWGRVQQPWRVWTGHICAAAHNSWRLDQN